jgi:hypothetical protein
MAGRCPGVDDHEIDYDPLCLERLAVSVGQRFHHGQACGRRHFGGRVGAQIGARIGFDAIRQGDSEPLYVAAPAPPPRDVARLTRRAAAVLFAEARSAARAIGDATNDADAIDRISDIADDPPSGTTLVITGNDDHTRGRYDGVARGLLRDLEALGAIRSWGRFDLAADGSWQHRITVPAHRAQPARELVTSWLSLNSLDASLE